MSDAAYRRVVESIHARSEDHADDLAEMRRRLRQRDELIATHARIVALDKQVIASLENIVETQRATIAALQRTVETLRRKAPQC